MNNTAKRIISLILCICMILSMGIMNVFAAQTEQTGSYNLLVNPGAEEVDTSTGGITGWTLGNKATYQTNNPVTGTYGFKLNNSGDYIQQTVTVPETTTYKLTGWLSGLGTLGVYDADGSVIASVERNVKSYAMLTIEDIALEAGQVVTVKMVRGSGWLNADDLVFATTGTYEWVAAEKTISNIDAIADVEGTTGFLGTIVTARESYEGLSDEAKAGVRNYDVLLAAEAEIDYRYSEYNLLTNPDFEYGIGVTSGNSSIITGWTKNSSSWANNNAYSGTYHWALSANASAYISQEVVIPETTTYKLTGYISGGGTFGIYDSEGNVIQSVERNEKSYALLTMDNIALNEGDVVTIKCSGSSIWLNGDEFVFATTDTYDLVMVNKVKVKIDDIEGLTGGDRKSAISEARRSYDALSNDLKPLVTNYEDLLEAENEAAAAVVAMIDALGQITEESLSDVTAARDAYESLSDLDKEKVLNLPVLEAAEEALYELGVLIEQRMTPLMGWSSWNCYYEKISEEKLISQIDALVATGLADAGYIYFNIDDAYQGGRDEETGLVISNPNFPNGMKYIADYAHAKGLKAGIYSDAGSDTCATRHRGQGADGTGWGVGVGLYGHEYEDLYQYFIDWGYDYIKVDWCGGSDLGLNEQEQYTKIGRIIDELELVKGSDIVYNVCRWKFPGEWVVDVADSWRTAGDIRPTWDHIMTQINAIMPLAQYTGPGHVNDPDMLEVGNGMSYDEDKTHFSMWCMLSAPLVLGNDLTAMTEETLEILTNEELIAIDQDPAVIMATVAQEQNGVQTWVKPLGSKNSNVKAVALFNMNNYTSNATVKWSDLGYSGAVEVRDLWEHEDLTAGESLTFTLPAHGCVVLKVSGESSYSEDVVIKANLTDAPEEPDLEAQGTLDWADVLKGTEKDNAYIVTEADNDKVVLDAVSTRRAAYVYFSTSQTATLTATLDGKETSDVFTGDGVYTIEYAGKLGGGDLNITIEGGFIDAVAVADVPVSAQADTDLMLSVTEQTDSIDLTEGTVGYVSFATENGTIWESRNLSDFVTAEGAEFTTALNGTAQTDVYDYFEIYLPAADTLTRANIYYGLTDGSATAVIRSGSASEELNLYELDGSENGILTVWYTADQDVTVVLKLDAVYSDESFLSLKAVTVSREDGAVLTRPVVTENNGTLDITAQTGGNAANVKFVAEIHDAEGAMVASSVKDVTLGGEAVNSVTMPEDFSDGSLKMYLSSGDAAISDVYTVALPLENESAPADLVKIGNLLAQKLAEEGAILIDVRSAEEYEAGHIDGAINIEYTDIRNAAAAQLPDKAVSIIVYCSAGKRSAQAQMTLLDMGYEAVYNLGTMDNWYIEPSAVISAPTAESLEENTRIGITYVASPYEKDLELYYALGKDASFEDAVAVPEDHAIELTGDGWVKAYLTWQGEVIDEEVQKLPLLVNVEIPEYEVDVYMSDLTWDTNESYWKAAKKDLSIDGNALSIAGNSFEKGIGAHAWSVIEAQIPEGMTRFVAVGGVDDEMADKTGYKTKYAVYIDDVLMEESLELPIGYYHLFDITFPVGAKTIRLETYNTDDGTNYDHSDWGIAGFIAPTEEEVNAAAAKDVIEMIDALGEITSLDQEADVVAARDAYEALTEEQQKLVGIEYKANLNVAEQHLELLKEKIEYVKKAAKKELTYIYNTYLESNTPCSYVMDQVTVLLADAMNAIDAIVTESEAQNVDSIVDRFAEDLDTINGTCPAQSFPDVELDEWYHPAVDFAVGNGFMKGDVVGTFRPIDPITRAEMAQILYNIEGKPEFETDIVFSDVEAGNAAHWFYDAVMWAASEGLVKGDPEGTYRPEDLITREEMVTIIWRYMGSEKVENSALTFDDAAEVSGWAIEPIAWAVENGVVKGTGGNRYEPKANTERAAIAQVMLNLFG